MKKRLILFAILAAFLVVPMSSMALNWDATYWNALIKGNLRVGTGSTPNITQNGDDVYIEGQLEVDGVPRFDATTMTIRGVTYTLPSADGSAGQYLQTNGSGTLSFAAGTLATGDAITGDGTAALGGFLKTVTNDTDAHSVLASESGTILTNAGAGDAYAHTLPSAAVGLNYCFVVMAAQELRVTPAAGDSIIIAGVAGDAAEYWTANTIGKSLCLVATDVNTWVATSYAGTWTQAVP